MKEQHQGREANAEIEIGADPQAVFDAFAKPDLIARWFVDSASGDAEKDDVVYWTFRKFVVDLPVAVLEAERGRRILLRGGTSGPLPSLIEIVLEGRGGSTLVRLVQSGFSSGAEWDDEYEGVSSGWRLALAQLRYWLEGHRGSPRAHRLAMRPTAAPVEYAAIQPYFTTAKGLTRWLAREAALSKDPLRNGATVRLALHSGEALTGEVLERTDREILLSWPERDATLSLKAFSFGPPRDGKPSRAIALDYNAWGRSESEADEMERELDGRLAALDAELSRRTSPSQ